MAEFKPQSELARRINERAICLEEQEKIDKIDPEVLEAGFTLLPQLASQSKGGGYGLARTLGRYVDQHQEFAPNQSDPKYQGENGNLTESFFSDTVANAQAWWKENRASYEQAQ